MEGITPFVSFLTKSFQHFYIYSGYNSTILDTSSVVEYCRDFNKKDILIGYFLEIWRYLSINDDAKLVKSLDAIRR